MIETELRKIIENMVNEMVVKDSGTKPHITKNIDTEPMKKTQNIESYLLSKQISSSLWLK